MKSDAELQALLQRQVQCSAQRHPPACPGFPDMTRTCRPQVLPSPLRLCTMLAGWRPSGIAEFSILNFSNFSITRSDVSLVVFCVYSVSPGQFMDLFLAFSLKSSWESQDEVRRTKIQVKVFNFLSWDFYILLVWRTSDNKML